MSIMNTTPFQLLSGPHSPPPAPFLSDENFDISGSLNMILFVNALAGDLVFLTVSANMVPGSALLDIPPGGTSGPWTVLHNGETAPGSDYDSMLLCKVATANDFIGVTISASGDSFVAVSGSTYRVTAGNHNVVTPSTDVQTVVGSGNGVTTATMPGITIPANERLVYFNNFFGNNGNAALPNPPPGTTLININGGGDTSDVFFDANDQTVGTKSGISQLFASSASKYFFYSVTYP